jgi:hypothetical protein
LNLQKAPSFLLDLFRLKTTGFSPTQFADAVVPTTDVSSMYGAEMQVTGASNGSAGAFPRSQSAFTGVASRYWGLAGSVIVGAAAGTQIQLTIGVTFPRAGNFFPIASTLIITPQALRTYYVGGLFPCGPIVLPPGGSITVIAAGDAAGADHNTSLFTYLEDFSRG